LGNFSENLAQLRTFQNGIIFFSGIELGLLTPAFTILSPLPNALSPSQFIWCGNFQILLTTEQVRKRDSDKERYLRS